MKRHKNADIIKAYIEGIECEFFGLVTNQWLTIDKLETFDVFYQVRIKPEQQEKTKEEPQYLYVYNDANRRESWMSPTFIQDTYGWNYMGKVRVEK